ncbi:MAG: sialidase family protein [Planctomycetota bacterium]
MTFRFVSVLAGMAATACLGSLPAQVYPRSSRLPRAETKANEQFVNSAVHGFGGWQLASPRERVAAGPAGTVPTAQVAYLTYLDADAAGVESLRFRRSTNGGLTWGVPQALYSLLPNEVVAGGETRIVASLHDVFIVWASNAHTLAPAEQAVFAVGSSDQGQTWTAPTLLTPAFLTMLKDADDVHAAISRGVGNVANLNVVFEADTPALGNEDIYFVQAEVQGGNLAVTVAETRLNAAVPAQAFDVDFTAIAAHGPVVHVVWCDDRSGVENDYFSMTSNANGRDWATVSEYRHTNLPSLSWGSPRRPQAAVDLPNVYTFMEHAQNGRDDVWMDWSQDIGFTWAATGVAINTATLGSVGDVDGMLVEARDQSVAVLYVDDRLNGANNNDNNQAVVAVSRNGGLDFRNGTHVEVPLSSKDPNPIYGIEMVGDTVAALYETHCGSGGEGVTVSLSADGGLSFAHYDVTSFDACGSFPSAVDVDSPTMALTANGDCVLAWADDRTFAGGGGGNAVNNLWLSGIKYPLLVDDTASGQGVTYLGDAPAAAGNQCYVVLSLSTTPNVLTIDGLGNELQIGYDILTEASVTIADQAFPSINRDAVGADGSVAFPLFPNVGQLLGVPVYALAFSVTAGGTIGGFTDPVRMR